MVEKIKYSLGYRNKHYNHATNYVVTAIIRISLRTYKNKNLRIKTLRFKNKSVKFLDPFRVNKH